VRRDTRWPVFHSRVPYAPEVVQGAWTEG